MDQAADGSFPCRTFLQHRHCQFLLESTFCGAYRGRCLHPSLIPPWCLYPSPTFCGAYRGSGARIPIDAPLATVLLQARPADPASHSFTYHSYACPAHAIPWMDAHACAHACPGYGLSLPRCQSAMPRYAMPPPECVGMLLECF